MLFKFFRVKGSNFLNKRTLQTGVRWKVKMIKLEHEKQASINYQNTCGNVNISRFEHEITNLALILLSKNHCMPVGLSHSGSRNIGFCGVQTSLCGKATRLHASMAASDRSPPRGVLGCLRCAGNSIEHYASQPGWPSYTVYAGQPLFVGFSVKNTEFKDVGLSTRI